MYEYLEEVISYPVVEKEYQRIFTSEHTGQFFNNDENSMIIEESS